MSQPLPGHHKQGCAQLTCPGCYEQPTFLKACPNRAPGGRACVLVEGHEELCEWETPSKEEHREAVDHPAHYGGADDPYEAIKVIDAWLGPEGARAFSLGNAVKYLNRAGKKGDLTEDLRKAAWYLDHAIDLVQRAETG